MKKMIERGFYTTEYLLTILIISLGMGFVVAMKFSLAAGAMVGLGIILSIALILMLIRWEIKSTHKEKVELKAEVQRAYPLATVKQLSNGKWLISSRETGDIIDEITWPSR